MAKNKKRIFDQTASMHFKLSDEYKIKYTIEDAVEIIISVTLCGMTFLDHEKYFHLSKETSALVMGFSAIFLLTFTLVKQRLNHKQLYEKHQLAGKMYVQAKQDISSQLIKWQDKRTQTDDADILKYIDDHFRTLNELPQIPERHFNRLKHYHLRKVALSKYVDHHYDAPWPKCMWEFLCKKKT